MDVIYTGLHRTPEEVAAAAVQEDVDVLGVSVLSGAHMTLIPRIVEQLRQAQAGDILLVAGGVIPDEDVAALRAMGVADVVLQDTPPDVIVTRIRALAAARQPPPDAEHWLPQVECAEPAARDELVLAKLRHQLRWAWERSPFYRRKWLEAGVSPDTLRSLDDLRRFPVVQKADLRLAQAAHPPFGDYLCVEPGEVARIHGTSGTTGHPTVFGVGRKDWERVGEAHARILWGAGVRPDDRILICSFFSLYLGSWGALEGAERLRA